MIVDPETPAELVPAVLESEHFDLKAVYSGSKVSSEDVAATADVDPYFDDPEDPASSLEALFQRPDIQAVLIALPTSIQAKTVFRALGAGKHVLCENPIAQDVEATQKWLKRYDPYQKGKLLWSVGEKFRLDEAVLFAAHQLKKLDASMETFSLRMHGSTDIKSLDSSACQNLGQSNELPIGAGIHLVAALRVLLSAFDESITHVAAFTSGNFLNCRTNATMRLSNGNSGTLSLTSGTRYDREFLEVQIVTDRGMVTLTDRRVTILEGVEGEETEQATVIDFGPVNKSVKRMVEVFAKSIMKGKVEVRGAPAEALADLKILQAMLESGENGGAVRQIH